MKKLLGALAVTGLALLAAAPGAEAATCWWNGYTWVCRTPPYGGHWRGHYWRHAYGPWPYRHWHNPYWAHDGWRHWGHRRYSEYRPHYY